MQITPFAGLTRVAPGESLAANGFALQDRDVAIIDRLLQVGAVTHRHDGHARLADPTADPVVNVFSGGGAIGPDISASVGYTLVDFDGGETMMSDVVTVSTPSAIPAPEEIPDTTVVTSSGALRSGLYYYTLTLKDALGGETTAGPAFPVEIAQGSNTNSVQFSGLAALLGDAEHWVLYRSDGGGTPQYMAEGSAATFTDDGINCAVSIFPPEANTTRGDSYLGVTVPAPDPDAVALFRVYLDTEGAFESPCLLGEYPLASAAAPIRVNAIDVLDGSPPLVSRTLPGAQPVRLEDIEGLTWQAPVADEAALPSAGVEDGAARVVLSSPPSIHVWVDGAWSAISGGGGGGGGEYIGPSTGGGGTSTGGAMADAGSWGAIQYGSVSGEFFQADSDAAPLGAPGYGIGIMAATSNLPAGSARRVSCVRMVSDSEGFLINGMVAMNENPTFPMSGVGIRINALVYQGGDLGEIVLAGQVGNSAGPWTEPIGGPDGVEVQTLPNTTYWLAVEVSGDEGSMSMWDSDPAPGGYDTSTAIATASVDLARPDSTISPGDVSAVPLFPFIQALNPGGPAATPMSGLYGFAGEAAARSLTIGFPEPDSPRSVIWDEVTGHSPWEFGAVTASGSTVAFPKGIELVAGAGIEVSVADDGDGNAVVTIGLA